MYESYIGKLFGELEILDIYRVKTKENKYFAKCKCVVCGAVGESRFTDVAKGKSKSCRNYNNRIEVSGCIVNIYTHSGKAIVLDLDFYLGNENKNYHIGGKGYPSQSTGYNGHHSLVHRTVLGIFDRKIIIDHKNRNKLDNRRSNLRTCSISQNGMNQSLQKNRKIPKTTKYKGVRAMKYISKTSYYARIKMNRKETNLGRFNNPEDAARAYDEAAIEMFGEFALTNKQLGLL